MIDTHELDRVWRDGLARLSTSTATLPEPAGAVQRRVHRRRGRRLALAGAVAATLVAGVLSVAALHNRDRVSSAVAHVPLVVVRVVDAPGGTLAIEVPGRDVVDGAVQLPAGRVELDVAMETPGHVLTLSGVPAFATIVAGTGGAHAVRTVDLGPGEYRLYCSVFGHDTAGEHVTFVVR